MSVPNQTPYIIYNANGITTVFPFEFYIISASDMQVSLNGTVITAGYSVSGAGNVSGGDVTFLTPPANGTEVMLERVVPTLRLTEYQDNGDLLAATVNKDFDRLWMAVQRGFIYLGLALTRPLFGGPYNAKGYRIENLADPLHNQDAATRGYIQQVALTHPQAGGSYDARQERIVNLADPASEQDAATPKYVQQVALTHPQAGGPYDARGARIVNLADPVSDGDAASMRYVQQVDQASLGRTLRVPENAISMLPPVEQRANKLFAFNAAGQPIAEVPQPGSAADVLVQLAKPTGAGLVGYNAGTVAAALDGVSRIIQTETETRMLAPRIYNSSNSYISVQEMQVVANQGTTLGVTTGSGSIKDIYLGNITGSGSTGSWVNFLRGHLSSEFFTLGAIKGSNDNIASVRLELVNGDREGIFEFFPDGELRTNGGILADGPVTATGDLSGKNVATSGKISAAGNINSSGDVIAAGNIIAGNGGDNAVLQTNGDIYGSAWGGYLSAWLNAYVSSKANTASLGGNGWWRCGSTGFMIQWGYAEFRTGDSILFPVAFPSASATVTIGRANDLPIMIITAHTNTYFNILRTHETIGATLRFYWVATGF